MSAELDGPSEHAEPRRIGFDHGWVDGWEGLPPSPVGDSEVRANYRAGYELGVRERTELESRAYCVDCEGVHGPGECALVDRRRGLAAWWDRFVGSSKWFGAPR